VLYYRASDKEPFTEYMRTGFKDSFSPLFFTFDNKNLYVSTNLNGRDKTAIVEWDLAGKKEVRELYANPDYDVDGLDYSRKRQALTMVTWTGEKSERKILDPMTKALYDTLEASSLVMNTGCTARTTTRTSSWCGWATTGCPANTTTTTATGEKKEMNSLLYPGLKEKTWPK
jgi:hypothetical protein